MKNHAATPTTTPIFTTLVEKNPDLIFLAKVAMQPLQRSIYIKSYKMDVSNIINFVELLTKDRMNDIIHMYYYRRQWVHK